MTTAKVAIDPLWQCLCPSWTPASFVRASRFLQRGPRPIRQQQCLRLSTSAKRSRFQPISEVRYDASPQYVNKQVFNPLGRYGRTRGAKALLASSERQLPQDLEQDETEFIYGRLRAAAARGHAKQCRYFAEYLVKERGEKPNLQIYNALIAVNVHHEDGAAWRVSELLEEMRADGLQPDVGTCHAALKVLSIHLDHLLRSDILEYMGKKWFQLSEDGAHDVTAGLFRDALFEQALLRLDKMRQDQMHVEPWLYDMAVFMLCEAGEVEEAYRIMRMRYDTGERNLRRSVWSFLLDKASEYRHHDATSFVWTCQVNQGYLNPSSGVCMNVLATAAQVGDAAMATEVFTHLSKRGTAYKPIHFELLIQAYLSAKPPDSNRAISILTIMPMEKLEPTIAQTRALFLYLRDKPDLVKDALLMLRELHQQGRKISIAVLNLLIECYVEQKNLDEAMKVYKLIHTFAPMSQGAQKSFANIETFNLLLKGCRTSNPPDAQRASFLVSELLALRVIPTSITYDRLILVFVEAARTALRKSKELSEDPAQSKQQHDLGRQMLDWSFRHFTDMQPLGWMPRFGTLEVLAIELASAGDDRCWDVLQVAEDEGNKVEGFEQKGKWARRNVEQAWEKFLDEKQQQPEEEESSSSSLSS
ncbi:Protein Rf1, mitochondrial [Pseudocercospora fuligena]|uniref:Protein Rf1, mitochondrial n=1 Tax=Pseudocercospora fuligena TaxID=685502 RepID=A0A8H6VL41_9PEZI|nr:Protein Rf1, mitochondrial [Pseudocercospora fuligena]